MKQTKQTTFSLPLSLIGLLLLLTLLTGCATFYSQMASDQRGEQQQHIQEVYRNELNTLDKGQAMIITRNDGEVWTGRFQGFLAGSHILMKRSRGAREMDVERIEWDMINHIYRVDRSQKAADKRVRVGLISTGVVLDILAITFGALVALAFRGLSALD